MSKNPDRRIGRRELAALLILVLVFGGALLYALTEVRKEERDGIRRQHLSTMKHGLELFFNAHERYPAPPSQSVPVCTTQGNAEDWFFVPQGPLLKERILGSLPSDAKEPSWGYQYCVEVREGYAATAWYLRARLERARTPTAAFDAEEGHNFYTRIVREDGVSYFDICGGTLTCGALPLVH